MHDSEMPAPVDFRKGRRRNGHPSTQSEPPHSPEGEQGVLGCLLLSAADCIAACRESLPHSGHFHDIRNRTIYESILSLSSRGHPIEVMSVHQTLRDNGELENAGGLPYLASLPDTVPSAANLPYYLELVREKTALRDAIVTCQKIVARAHDHSGDMPALADEIERSLKRLVETTRGAEMAAVGQSKSFAQLRSYDTDHDANCLLGVRVDGTTSRYLCRKGSGWIIGPSGIGKSSLAVMMGVHWSAGVPSFGITPTRPLRITIIQAENDDGDMSEMAKGVCDGMADSFIGERERELIEQNLKFRDEGCKTGLDFCRWLERVIRADHADLVVMDPFLSFAGIDVSKQSECTTFLRKWLNPVLQSTGAAIIGMHHTGKPKIDRATKGMRPLTALEQAYEGLGSSELVNWARLVMGLRECGDGIFQLILSKRSNRAGATHPDQSPTNTVWLRQGRGRIWWDQIPPPEENAPEGDLEPREPKKTKAQVVASMNLANFLDGCLEGGESQRAITKRLSEWSNSKHSPQKISISKSSARDAIDLMLNSGKLECDGGLYFKGPNA